MKDIRYYYDAAGKPVAIRAFVRNNANESFSEDGDIYYLQTNLQGDVVGIYNKNGTKIYEYAYDAWGNIIKSSQVATGGTAAHAVNPFRYRGYYYDTETGFYYLQSRYYNPEWGRFLNADVYVNANGDLVGFNMFAYCSNNPVMGVDSFGDRAMPFGELTWPGEIHLAVQIHAADANGLTMEVPVLGGRADLVKETEAFDILYEVKPCTYYSGYRLLVALAQLQYYQSVYHKPCIMGSYIDGATFQYKDYTVSYWYEGFGLILYSFYKTPSKTPGGVQVPKKNANQSKNKKHSDSGVTYGPAIVAALTFSVMGGKFFSSTRRKNT